MSKRVRATVWSLVLALAAGAMAAPAAYAVQASGSILLIPSKQAGIMENEEITVEVYFQNTSSTTPSVPPGPPLMVTPNPATLDGPVSIDLSSTDCGGIANSTALQFIPGPAAGCESKNAAVTGCAAGLPGEVLINFPANSILALDATPVFLATIKLKNTILLPNTLPRLNLRASTGTCAVESCGGVGVNCAQCGAEGCSFVAGVGQNNILRCKHSCLNRIEFNPNPNKFIFQGVMLTNGTYDPATQPFSISVGPAGGPPLLTVSLPSVMQVGPRAWRETNGPNFDRVQIQQQTGPACTNSFRVAVDAFSNALAALQLMGNPMVTVSVTLGAETFTNTESWTSIVQGGVVIKLQNDYDMAS